MDGTDEPGPAAGPADDAGVSADDGVAAVLYGMFTSFTEALDGFDRRLAAIEAALRAGPGETAERLRSIESALAAAGAPAGPAQGTEAALKALGEAVEARTTAVEAALAALAARVTALGEAIDGRTPAVQDAVDDLRRLLRAHMDETSHSLGRRAGEAGRRLAADLGLRPRPRPGGGPPAPGGPP